MLWSRWWCRRGESRLRLGAALRLETCRTVTRLLTPLLLRLSSAPPPTVYANDHITPSTADSLPLAVLHANPTESSFAALFSTLHALAAPPTGSPRIQLALRWKPLSSQLPGDTEKLVLSGYGAMLDIKKVDYIAIDDRAKKASAGAVQPGEEQGGARIYPVSEEALGSASSQ